MSLGYRVSVCPSGTPAAVRSIWISEIGYNSMGAKGLGELTFQTPILRGELERQFQGYT